jgi:hypothetical protein
MILAERNDIRQALVAYRAHEAPGERVQIGAACWKSYALHAAPSYFFATSFRYQPNSVRGVTSVSSIESPLRPSFFAAIASLRRCASVYRMRRPRSCSRNTASSAIKYSVTACGFARHPAGHGQQQKLQRRTRHRPHPTPVTTSSARLRSYPCLSRRTPRTGRLFADSIRGTVRGVDRCAKSLFRSINIKSERRDSTHAVSLVGCVADALTVDRMREARIEVAQAAGGFGWIFALQDLDSQRFALFAEHAVWIAALVFAQ